MSTDLNETSYLSYIYYHSYHSQIIKIDEYKSNQRGIKKRIKQQLANDKKARGYRKRMEEATDNTLSYNDKNVTSNRHGFPFVFLRFSVSVHILLANRFASIYHRTYRVRYKYEQWRNATMMTPCYHKRWFVCVTAQDDARKNTIIVIVRSAFDLPNPFITNERWLSTRVSSSSGATLLSK